MSIKPIDLQTLFMHMNQVGKEQAQIKEGLHLQQVAFGRELVREAEHSDNSVNQAHPLSDGPEEIHEDQGNTGGGRRRGKKEGTEGENKEEATQEYFRDPDVGTKIDITG